MTSIPLMKVDGRGRVSLGKGFAHRLVLMRELAQGCVQIELAEAVPAREAWLHKNQAAFESVMRGLEQSGRGEFATAPKLGKDDADD
jgi:hypothetical protein